jgi:hypothetical protein
MSLKSRKKRQWTTSSEKILKYSIVGQEQKLGCKRNDGENLTPRHSVYQEADQKS